MSIITRNITGNFDEFHTCFQYMITFDWLEFIRIFWYKYHSCTLTSIYIKFPDKGFVTIVYCASNASLIDMDTYITHKHNLIAKQKKANKTFAHTLVTELSSNIYRVSKSSVLIKR